MVVLAEEAGRPKYMVAVDVGGSGEVFSICVDAGGDQRLAWEVGGHDDAGSGKQWRLVVP